ncbi:MAG: ABC transporter ATP-binding protein [Sphingobacteriia bacterium]|jgi:lipoprotein-releasing system ATP-binding protein
MMSENTSAHTPGASPILVVQGIHKHYGKLPVLKGVDLALHPREAVALLGASGAGKSTLLQIMGTLDRPDAGQLYYAGAPLHSLKARALAHFRNQQLGFVFQFHHLLPEFSALENASMPAYIAGTARREAEARAEALLVELGLGERLHHKPSEMSGGEQQRTAIARALINQPKVLLADEPTGNLDTPNGEKLINLLLDLAECHDLSILIATHNHEFAARCHRQVYMQDGTLQ